MHPPQGGPPPPPQPPGAQPDTAGWGPPSPRRVTKLGRRGVVAIVACCVLVVIAGAAGVALPYLVGNRDGSWADEHKVFRDPCAPALEPVKAAGFTHEDAVPATAELPDRTILMCAGDLTAPSSDGGWLRIEATFYKGGRAIRAAKPRFDHDQEFAELTNRTGVESFIWSEKGFISTAQTDVGEWNTQVRALDVNLDLTIAISGMPDDNRQQLTDLAGQIARAYLDGPMKIE